jgi:hypothetical protein
MRTDKENSNRYMRFIYNAKSLSDCMKVMLYHEYQVTTCSRIKTIFIGLHTEHAHNKQPFTWLAAYNSSTVIASGEPQVITSSNCSSTRGNFIGLSQALQSISSDISLLQPPLSHRLVICTRNPRTLKILKKGEEAHRSPIALVGEETGLVEEIIPCLRTFQSYRTHTFSKRDHSLSTEKFLLHTCLTGIANESSPQAAQYSPSGYATLWIEGLEISNNIASSLRHTGASTVLNKHLQRKNKWSDNTLATIDWRVLGRALRPLSDHQRKKITQMIHHWLPVNGHPGRALHSLERKCPVCQDAEESQAHLFTCPALREKWHELIANSALTTDTFNSNNHINTILVWALTHPHDTASHPSFPKLPNQYLTLVETQQLIGWNQVLLGRWTNEWAHQLDLLHPNSGDKMAATKLTEIWRIVLQLWNHQHRRRRRMSNRATIAAKGTSNLRIEKQARSH